jgi:hypothetical protein
MPTLFFVAAACAGDCSDGLGSVAVDLAGFMRFEAVFVEDSSSPVFADLAMPLRAARREAAVAWSASVGVLERVFRVGIQLDLVRYGHAMDFYYIQSLLMKWLLIIKYQHAAK